MEKLELPFGALFDRAVPARGGHAWWRCNDPDLNRAAGMLLSRVDRILEQTGPSNSWVARHSMQCAISASSFDAAVGLRSFR